MPRNARNDEDHEDDEQGPPATRGRRRNEEDENSPPPEDADFIFSQLPPNLPKSIKKLGKPLTLHKGSTSNAIVVLSIGVLLSIFGPIAIGWGVFGRVEVPIWTIGCGVVSLTLGVLAIVGAFFNSKMRVAVFEKGLVYVWSRRIVVIPWVKIEAVWQKITDHYTSHHIYVRTTYQYTIKIRDVDEAVTTSLRARRRPGC